MSLFNAISRKSMSNLQAAAEAHTVKKDFPTTADAYNLLEECGRGVSATVYRAVCTPLNEQVAVKRLNLETMACSLEEIIREAQTMRQLSHPNVLPLHCSFVSKEVTPYLWMVMPYVAGGSVLNIMKYTFPEGLEEPVIATIMKEVLKGLDYIHKQGCIHRDVKAGNILIDKDGQVYLADFGVSSSMERTGSWGHQQAQRKTFVGTPCWMAPEVMEQRGYGPLADIWSFGITILELAHGHAPFAKLPPMKVLMMTIQNPPPTLDTDSNKKHFSKAMRDIVAKCLVKDPMQRPTAAQLLEHKFFKTAHDSSYLVKHLLAVLPPLPERVRQMRVGGAAELRQQAIEMSRSQEAYVKGVSAWKFDVEALKEQAAREEASRPPPLATVPEASTMQRNSASNRSSATDLPDLATSASAPPPGPPSGAQAPAQAAPANGMGATALSMPLTTAAMGEASRGGPFPNAPALAGTGGKEGPPPLDVLPSVGSSGRPPIGASPIHVRSSSSDRENRVVTPNRDKAAPLQSSVSTKGSLTAKPAVHKKQGRFDVWEGDADETETTALEHRTSQMSEVPDGARAADGENPEKSKRKGRFHIVEEESVGVDKRPSIPRANCTTGGATGGSMHHDSAVKGASAGVASPTQQAAALLLSPLKELQDQLQGPFELLKELVVAVGDSERGKPGHLHSLLQERVALRSHKEDHDKLKAEVVHLREENTKLRDKLKVMENKLQRIQLESQTPMPSPDKRLGFSGSGDHHPATAELLQPARSTT